MLATVALAGAGGAQARLVATTAGHDAGLAPRMGAVRVAAGGTEPVVAHAAAVMAAAPADGAGASTGASLVASGPAAFPPGYEQLIDQYFTDVAAASGQRSNDYSVAAQYGDTLDAPLSSVDNLSRTYAVSFNGASDAIDDDEPYPADRDSSIGGAGHDNPSGCAPDPADGLGDPAYTWCLTDAQIQREISRVIAAQGWPAASMSAIYFVFLPPTIDECWSASGGECAGEPNPNSSFCAYHSSFGASDPGPPLYAVLPYGDVTGCRTGEAPNGAGAGGDDPGDDETSMISHEQNETIDDPLENAWLDGAGYETADLCTVPVTAHSVFGTPLGGAPGQEYNQVINGHDYWLQDEFANRDPSRHGAFDACEQRPGGGADTKLPAAQAPTYHGGPVLDASTAYAIFWAPTTTATAPAPALSVSASVTHAGQPVTFDASASQGANLSYSWSFGDGHTASGAVVSHAFASAGSLTVTLTVQDSQTEYTATEQQTEVVYPEPVATFSATPQPVNAGTAVTFHAGDPPGAAAQLSYSWSFGDGTTASGGPGALHAYAAPGSYTVTLTVADATGASATSSRVILVLGLPQAGSPRSAPAAPPVLTRLGPAHLRLSGSGVLLLSGVRMSCPAGDGHCRAKVAVIGTAHDSGGPAGGQSIGAASVVVAAGRSRQVAVAIDAAGLAILRSAGRLRATVSIVAWAADTPTATAKVTGTVTAPGGP